MARIRLDNVSLTFEVRATPHLTWKDFFLKRLFQRQAARPHIIHALRNIDLDIGDGERVGILGHNGAGKSTLLKVIAGIYPPCAGKRSIEGRISSLFELSLGFELEATGWENIRYRGYLQGETPQSIDEKLESIAAFSELGEHLDIPVRYYSAGMLVRLAFSIATAMVPEILLIDEILGAGDRYFQKKARKRMAEMISRARLIVMVSHDLRSLERLCDRVIWLDQGAIYQEGPGHEVIAEYARSTKSRRKSPSNHGADRSQLSSVL